MAISPSTSRAGACPICTGLGTICEANLGQLIDPERSVAGGGVLTWTASQSEHYGWVLQNAGQYYGFPFDLNAPTKTLGPVQRDLLLYGTYGPSSGGTFRMSNHRPRLGRAL